MVTNDSRYRKNSGGCILSSEDQKLEASGETEHAVSVFLYITQDDLF